MSNPERKIIPYTAVTPLVEHLKSQNEKVVLTTGVFDILHAGHLKALNAYKDLGDNLIVGVDSDSLVKRSKGNHLPILDQEQRSYLISGFECVDYVTIFDGVYDLVQTVKPDILIMSKTSTLEPEKRKNETDFVNSYGGEVKIFEAFSNTHSSDLISKIKRSDTK